MGEKLVEYESLASRLQRNLENVLAEKFGDLDPGSAEFFLQEERLAQVRSEYERQCRELQDQIDELHSELEEYRAQGKVLRPGLKNSLSEEFNIDMKSYGNSGIEPDQGLGSEDCNPLNMSIEAEMAIEQMKEQHHRDLHHLKQKLEDTVSYFNVNLPNTSILFLQAGWSWRRTFYSWSNYNLSVNLSLCLPCSFCVLLCDGEAPERAEWMRQ